MHGPVASVAGVFRAPGDIAGDDHEAPPAAPASGGAIAAKGTFRQLMWWPAPDTSRRPVRQRGHAGVTSRVNSPRRRRPGVLAEQLVHEGGGPQRVGDQVRAAPGPRHRDVEEPALLVVGVVALRRRRQHEVDERVGLLLRGEAPPRVPEVEHDRVVGLRPFAAWTVLNSSRSRPRRRARSAARLSR